MFSNKTMSRHLDAATRQIDSGQRGKPVGNLFLIGDPDLYQTAFPAKNQLSRCSVRDLSNQVHRVVRWAVASTQLEIADVPGKQVVETRLYGIVTLREENTAAALEVMSRFADDPRWLIHLPPPTMSPA